MTRFCTVMLFVYNQWCDLSCLLINSPVDELMLTTLTISCETFIDIQPVPHFVVSFALNEVLSSMIAKTLFCEICCDLLIAVENSITTHLYFFFSCFKGSQLVRQIVLSITWGIPLDKRWETRVHVFQNIVTWVLYVGKMRVSYCTIASTSRETVPMKYNSRESVM